MADILIIDRETGNPENVRIFIIGLFSDVV
jgi:hypothetical protein